VVNTTVLSSRRLNANVLSTQSNWLVPFRLKHISPIAMGVSQFWGLPADAI